MLRIFKVISFILGLGLGSAVAEPGPRPVTAAAISIGVINLTNTPNHLTNWAKLTTNTLATVAAAQALNATNGLGTAAFTASTAYATPAQLADATNHTVPASLFPVLTGDATTSGGSLATTLASVGSAGTYRSVTTDAKGRVTAGTAPTTFSGYGLSDSSANLAAALTDETGTGVAVFGTSPTFTTKLTTPQSDYTTNTNPLIPDFTLGYQLFVTNAAFTFLAPAGVSTTLGQTTVVLVTNSTAAAVLVTAPANVHQQGTWYVTNVTAFTFFQYGQRFTNAYAFPLW